MAAFLVKYYEGIPFDTTRGWDTLLIGDPASGSAGDITFLLAAIAATDPKREYARSRHLLEPKPQKEAVGRLIFEALQRLDGWYQRLDLMRSALGSPACVQAFWVDFTDILRGRNANALSDLPRLVGQMRSDPDWQAAMDGANLHRIWTIPATQVHDPDLVHIHSAFTGATETLVAKSRDAIERTLVEISDHPPHTALLLAFLQMTGHVRDRLNLITGRHLDFYFRDVLRLSPNKAAPDVATIAFDLAPQAKPFDLPVGTKLAAGNDAHGQPILFSTNDVVHVTHAKIRELKAVRLRIASIETIRSRDGLRARADEVAEINAYPILNSKDGHGQPLDASDVGWPTFGAARGHSPCRIGLSIRSPMFRLSEGERQITIVMRLSDPRALSASVDAYLDRTGSSLDSSSPSLTVCFEIAVSTSTGFATVGHEAVFDRGRGTLRFTIRLPRGAPAITTPAGATPTASIGLPCVRILLNPDAPVYGYSHFKQLDLRYVSIKIAVKGLTSLVTNTTLGHIDAMKPFAPFGSPALRGATLTVTHADLVGKALTQMTINARWSNLPTLPETFERYYASYGLGTTSQSFRFTVDGLVGQDWVQLGESDLALFAGDDTGLAAKASWSFSTRGVWTVPRPSERIGLAAVPFQPVIRMKLTAPDYGFGQAIYPVVLSRVVMEKAAKPADVAPALPNPPFVPIIDALTLDYRATAVVALSTDQRNPITSEEPGIYLVDAFGVEMPLANAALLPTYPAQGYLFLGIEGLKATTNLSLFINIQPRAAILCVGGAASDPRKRRKALRIYCLSGDQWIALTENNILADGTEALTRPGLLQLQLPSINPSRKRTFDPNLVWLRIEAEGDPDTYGRTIAFDCNGVEATRIVTDPTAKVGVTIGTTTPILPMGSITKLVGVNTSIVGVRQSLATVGGKADETLDGFRVRVSERLRHKERAILSHDYEAMVLEHFPSIGDAKCFGGPRGSVTVVVAPLRHKGVSDAAKAVPEYELQAIVDYLSERSSACIRRLIVRNPTYEPVRVIAWLQVSAGDVNAKIRSIRVTLDRFIAPWLGQPDVPMTIGTPTIDLSGLRSALGALPFVTNATGLSITHLHARRRREVVSGARADDLFYTLDDSERQDANRSGIRPALPHSVLVPAHHHLRVVGALGIGNTAIEDEFIVGTGTESRINPSFVRAPRRAGIGNLHIGEDFVVRLRRAGRKRSDLARANAAL